MHERTQHSTYLCTYLPQLIHNLVEYSFTTVCKDGVPGTRARTHAPDGKLTKGAVLEVATAAGESPAGATIGGEVSDDGDDEFFDAHDICS